MRFENVSILIDRVYDFIKEIRYCWVDDDGMICEQRGVFRINCIDCLDRTNIVMTAIAKAVMDIQVHELTRTYCLTEVYPSILSWSVWVYFLLRANFQAILAESFSLCGPTMVTSYRVNMQALPL